MESLCYYCWDCGVTQVKSKHDSFESLMRCDCNDGKISRWGLPRWSSKCDFEFTRNPPPLEWFKPTYKKSDSDNGIYHSIMDRSTQWTQRIEMEIEHWKYKFKETKGVS